MQKGQIFDFDKCPDKHFEQIGDADIDFGKASLGLLLKSKNWKTKDALEYIKDTLHHTVTGAPRTRKGIAELLVDARERKVTLPNEG